jgi:hypothetical protein
MKKNWFIVVAVVLLTCGCGRRIPRDEHGNPIFKSQAIGEFDLTNCSVAAYYYTMTNNIADRGSAFFVADQPTADQAMHFATHTPAFFFIIHTNRVVSALVTLEHYPREKPSQRFAFRIIRDPKKPSQLVPLAHTQAIPDFRAREMMDGPWDPSADLIVKNGKPFFVFNGDTNSVLLLPTVVEDLKKLIVEHKLHIEED